MQKQRQIGVSLTLVSVKEACCQIVAILCNSLQNFQDWKERENAWFSAWCQERVTNIEVLRAAMGVLVGLPVALIIAGLVLGGDAS